jgi:hypothetical protein
MIAPLSIRHQQKTKTNLDIGFCPGLGSASGMLHLLRTKSASKIERNQKIHLFPGGLYGESPG